MTDETTGQAAGEQRLTRPGRGRTAMMPAGFYAQPPMLVRPDGGVSPQVRFAGEDGRSKTFRFGELPLPGLHADFASALSRRIGPGGSRRTQRGATHCWQALRRFVLVLAGLADPPQRLDQLRVRHLERFRMARLETCAEKLVIKEILELFMLFSELPDSSRLDPELVEFSNRRGHAVDTQIAGPPGYSDRELHAIMTAARRDVVAIRDRIAAGERLLERIRANEAELGPIERERAGRLDAMARTGMVKLDHSSLPIAQWAAAAISQASQLFLVGEDLAPLMVFAAGLTGRNPETLKEMPADHRVIEGRALALTLTKRRRGKSNSRSTVHWEIDKDPARELRTPGSYYLLLHRLTARSREFSGTGSLWSIWAGLGRGSRANATTAGHTGPFDSELARKLRLGEWATRHGLTDDTGEPLELRLTRMKKTVEVRTAKQVGGHLPSARRTNSADTSFTHYLRDDPFIQDWAAQTLTEAIDEAEANARDVVLRIVVKPSDTEAGRADTAARSGVAADVIKQAEAGELDTLVSSCLDIDHSPLTGERCTASFLTCLRCPNALVLERHLPMLLALVDSLQVDLDRRDVGDWARDHGQTWSIITRGILPRFSAGQLDAARRTKAAQLALDLLDGPKEPT